jgi:hypothetical protein
MMAVGAVLGAVLGAALLNAGAVVLSVMAIIGPKALGASSTRSMYLLFTNLGSVGAMGVALFIGAFSLVIIETGVIARVMGWLGALVAVVLVAAGGGIASTRDVFVVLTFIGLLGFALWTIVVSVLMYRGDGKREPVSVPVPVPEPASAP